MFVVFIYLDKKLGKEKSVKYSYMFWIWSTGIQYTLRVW